jgi:hypothetical protein
MLQRKQNAVKIISKEGEDGVAFASALCTLDGRRCGSIELTIAERGACPLLSPKSRGILKHVTATFLNVDGSGRRNENTKNES